MDTFPVSNHIRWTGIDFIKIKTKKFELPIDLKGKSVVITSQNAVKALNEFYPNEKLKTSFVYCVGEKTRAFLQEYGIEVAGVELYSKTISKRLVNDNKTESIVLFCGNMRRPELKEAALKNGIEYTEIIVYETTLIPQKLKASFDGIVFLSPSAVQSYIQLNQPNNSIAFCIGSTTEKEALKYFKEVVVSADLTIESVLDKVREYDAN